MRQSDGCRHCGGNGEGGGDDDEESESEAEDKDEDGQGTRDSICRQRARKTEALKLCKATFRSVILN